MELADRAVIAVLAIALLALHITGAIFILRTVRLCLHHAARLDELSNVEEELLLHDRDTVNTPATASAGTGAAAGRPAATEPPDPASLPPGAAAQAVRTMYGQSS